MNYGGQYQKEVILFLKAALELCIVQKYFRGGRGPGRFTHRDYLDLLYVNEISDDCSFLEFSGMEKIIDVTDPDRPLAGTLIEGRACCERQERLAKNQIHQGRFIPTWWIFYLGKMAKKPTRVDF